PVRGAEGSVSFDFIKTSSGSMSIEYAAKVEHYKFDESGFTTSPVEPFPGGYFSPQTFFSQSPRLAFKHSGPNHNIEFAGGPSFQAVKTDSTPTVHQVGADVWLNY